MQFPTDCTDFDTVLLVILNILVALRVWEEQWLKKIEIFCDNYSVVTVLTSRTKNRTLAAIGCKIKFNAAVANIDHHTVHIPGRNNVVADLLFCWSLTNHSHKKLSQLMPVHKWLNVPT